MNLGERLCKLRTQKKLSQGDLADALEVSRQSISKWETNASVPELDKLIKLSKIFEITLDELVTGEESAKEAETPIPEAPIQTQVICIEKPVKSGITAAQILGIILLSIALLCCVLFACFGKSYDFPETMALCLPVALWGVLCLVTKHPLLWCCWCGSATWWVYMFVLAAKWERETLLLVVGILLVAASLAYTVCLHKKGRIQVPAWCWALLTLVLTVGALLLAVNLVKPLPGTVRPSELVPAADASIVPK